MAWALMTPGSNRVLFAHPKLTVERGAYRYSIETKDGKSTYSVADGRNTLSVPIQWAFGSRSQTWVLEYQGHLYESLVSYFAAINALDVTIGDNTIRPRSLLEALGRELSESEAKSCFECHATGSVSDNHLHLAAAIPGVQCERCHTGAGQHADAVSHAKSGPAPQKLSRLTPEETSNFCGQCHRTFERVVRDRLFGEVNVRFQPYRLAISKCYDGGDARMSCTACHDPHKNVARGASGYDSKCLACHTGVASGKRMCPVATAGCTDCHMPKVELPGGHMSFTDHNIRVVRAGELYPY